MWKRNPPAIMLPPGVRSLPSFKSDAEKEITMHTASTSQAVSPSLSWFKFFQEERELWVQNLSATQLSIQFELSPGNVAGVLVPIGSDPLCITNEVPFDAVKRSIDFRKFLNRSPKVMRLMTTEEAEQYFADRAKSLRLFVQDPETGKQVPDVLAARAQAEQDRRRLTQRSTTDSTVVSPDGRVYFTPPKSALELQGISPEAHMGISANAASAAGGGLQPYDGNAAAFIQQAQAQAGAGGPSYGQPGTVPPAAGSFDPRAAGFANVGEQPVMMESVINPRVLNLCQQVSMQIDANLRMPADQFFREIKQLEAALTFEDLQYIEANGTYKTVKKWARDLQQKRVAEGQGAGLEDGLEEGA